MKVCTRCEVPKEDDDFYVRPKRNGALASWCKKCFVQSSSDRVAKWRKLLKLELIELAGDKCLDCSGEYPPFVMDFDHREPSEKSFVLNTGKIRNRDKALEELKKCDLVCANCHRIRTHKQRCSGCEFCFTVSGQDDNAAVC